MAHGHAPVDLGRAMKESHTLDENEHHRTALAAAEKDLEHMREEVQAQGGGSCTASRGV